MTAAEQAKRQRGAEISAIEFGVAGGRGLLALQRARRTLDMMTTPPRLRILLVLGRPLYPMNTGGRIRSSKLFERLARLHDITILCLRTPQDAPEDLERMRGCCAELELIDWSETPKFSWRFYADLAAATVSPLPYSVWKYRSAALRGRVRQRLASGAYDLLLCDFLQPTVNCVDLPFAPKVLFQHNVEAVIRSRHADHTANPLARAYLRYEARKLAAFERRAGHAFDHSIMVSEDDCRTMAAMYGVTSTSSIPTGVDVEYFTPRDAESDEPEVSFVGSMDWLPNQDAVRFFMDRIFPAIGAEFPARFVIIGRNPPEHIRQLSRHPGVTVSGTVPDIRPWLGRSHVMIVPMRVGGGTRIKIFEAMAMGVPVVSTRLGAEGLQVVHGDGILIADEPEAFARTVIDLLRNPARRRQLGEAGRRFVATSFTWDAAAARFSEICLAVVARTSL